MGRIIIILMTVEIYFDFIAYRCNIHIFFSSRNLVSVRKSSIVSTFILILFNFDVIIKSFCIVSIISLRNYVNCDIFITNSGGIF
jgi:hypothetical protein